MAIDAINGLTGNANGNSVLQYTPQVRQQPPATTTAAQDAVVLSITAQATLLQQQGLSVSEIAQQLGLATSVVQADLGITASVLTGASPLTKTATA